ncbi:E3 ubiquitin-protein ligase NRDP1-like [Bradysia coprophila]|uniref:E3 ubiquitin-protein ligase NRDP1-like n=1 Tax=Bradysia coprophila TaxID=38358 RepID=UPI00187D9898|nr:E3 ubiquitin-protein ligase NRDP1-like [Bradysia coprophila]
MGFEATRFIGEIDEEFICTICTLVLENPVQSSCEHTFCNQCITDWLAIENTCPVCRRNTELAHVKPVARYFRNMLNKLEIKCDFESRGCQSVLQLENLKDHVSNQCAYNPNTEIICDKGCNIAISRHEYEANNCFSHLSNALKKLQEKLDDQTKIVNTLRWQICYNMNISISEPNILEYGQYVEGELALVQSIRPLTPDNTSFKIEILHVGENNNIAIGLAPKGYLINQQPGCRLGSIGYHGDNGKFFNGNGIGEVFGPIWKSGDIIECAVQLEVYTSILFRGSSSVTVEVSFSINEQLIGKKTVKMPELGFFPTVSIRSKGGKVRYFDG